MVEKAKNGLEKGIGCVITVFGLMALMVTILFAVLIIESIRVTTVSTSLVIMSIIGLVAIGAITGAMMFVGITIIVGNEE